MVENRVLGFLTNTLKYNEYIRNVGGYLGLLILIRQSASKSIADHKRDEILNEMSLFLADLIESFPSAP